MHCTSIQNSRESSKMHRKKITAQMFLRFIDEWKNEVRNAFCIQVEDGLAFALL